MKALVTGGGGFLAGHLIDKLLEAGHSVRTVELPGRDMKRLSARDVEIIEGDLTYPVVELIEVMPGIDIEHDIFSASPMKIVVPENNDVPMIEPSIITGRGFRVKWQKDG